MHPKLKAAGDRHDRRADEYSDLLKRYSAARRTAGRDAAEREFRSALDLAQRAREVAAANHSAAIDLYARKSAPLVSP